MTLRLLLEDRRQDVLADWHKRSQAVHSEGMRALMGRGGDQFSNPVKGVLDEATASLYAALLEGADREELVLVLDTPVRLLALQGLTPSQAVGFVFELKHAVRHVLGKEIGKRGLEREVLALEQRIDEAALVAFDGYMGCREQLLRLRTNDERRTTLSYLKRAGLEVSTDAASSEGAGQRGANG